MARLPDPRFAADCFILADGKRIPARAGESVAAALLAAGRPLIGRSAKYHRPRGPFCLASSCAACLARVDGLPNVRTCETPCRDGLRVESQNALGGAAHDLLGAVDLFTPRGIDHHHLVTWSHWANRLAVSASRRLAGLGTMPDGAPPPSPPVAEERFDALVVGAGPAGLGAAEALARAGRRVMVAEQERRAGGRLRCGFGLLGDPPATWVDEVAAAVRRAGGELCVGAAVVGIWRAGGELLAALSLRGGPAALRLVRAGRAVVASGTWAQPPLFPGNDLPGIHAARGLAVALAEDGVVPGERIAVLAGGARSMDEAAAAAARFAAAGMQAEVVAGEVARARGGRRLAALDLADGRRVRCDALAAATPRTPAAELARALGAPLELDPDTGAFRVRPGERGAAAPGLFTAGEVCGPCSAVEAAEAGRRAGEGAARG